MKTNIFMNQWNIFKFQPIVHFIHVDYSNQFLLYVRLDDKMNIAFAGIFLGGGDFLGAWEFLDFF